MENLFQVLEKVSAASDLPLYCYVKGNLVAAFPAEAAAYPPPEAYLREMIADASPSPYFATDFSGIFGILPITLKEGGILIAGPVSPTGYTVMEQRQLMAEYGVGDDREEQNRFLLFLEGIMIDFQHRFRRTLEMIHTVINSESPEISFEREADLPPALSFRDIVGRSYSRKLNEDLNQSLEFQKLLSLIVESGDLKNAYQIRQTMFSMHFSTLSDEPLRNSKNLAVALATMLSYAAIRGGLDAQTSFELASGYIRHAEQMNSPEKINRLLSDSIVEFVQRVQDAKRINATSIGTERVIDYVREHIGFPMTVSSIAAAMGYNRDYLSSKFKKETGIPLACFITATKLEEAKKLLKYSDKPVHEISEFLYFSNQSYFQNQFKKAFGMTPLQYRKLEQDDE